MDSISEPAHLSQNEWLMIGLMVLLFGVLVAVAYLTNVAPDPTVDAFLQ